MTQPTFLESALEASLALQAWASSGELRRHYGGDQRAFIGQRLAALNARASQPGQRQSDGPSTQRPTGETQP
jgi:hypothetical protein